MTTENSRADALTDEQRHAVDEAVRVLRDNWEHGTAADLDMAFLPNQSGEESIKECDTDDEYRWPSAETPAPSPADERAARAIRLLEIAEPILEAAAIGKAVTIASGDLLRQVRAFLPADETAPARAASANETGAEGVTMRERFEAWAMGEFALAALPTRDGEGYHLIGVDDAWNTWKAALSRSSAK
ncbi:hypothetical protein [Burkholderia sp. EMB26]|uniref:hypothetical protein n=1 Tax=Burkholderia sp. EMB26 TaxID=2854261 RepID=UPI00215B3832|nr:hypothetical protein [Burkholderia sp. EMB26]UVE55272.1 hypothetical protein KU887_06255 [Burkholderia sp. EMB26]UVE57656.1 hypothetical protein KU887_19945 [Burkholderia sp. EMB26]